MKFELLLIIIVSFLIGHSAAAQNIEGIWKGSSLCQIKNSPCHDENVVYHITKNGDNSYQIVANKIIDGKEDYMGTIIFTFDPKERVLSSIDSAREVKWEFKVAVNQMHGTLISKGKLFRIIDLKKEG